MKSVLSLLLALSCASAFAATGNDYSTTVHVKSSHLVKDGNGVYLNLDAVIDGHAYELAADVSQVTTVFGASLLIPGDYSARIAKDDHKTAYKTTRVYELRYPDGKTERFAVTGMSE